MNRPLSLRPHPLVSLPANRWLRVAVSIAALLALAAAPALAAGGGGAAGEAPGESPRESLTGGWRTYGAETSLAFHPGVLDALGLEVISDLGPFEVADAAVLRFVAHEPFGIAFSAPHGAFAGFESGELRHSGGFSLHWPGGSAHFPDLVLRPVSAARPDRFGADVSLDLLDGDGEPLLYLDHVHSQLFADQGRLELRWMDVRLSAELARRIGQPQAAGMAVAVAHVVASARGGGDTAPLGNCTTPNFTLPIDVALSNINSVQQSWRESGRVAITPSATLQNVGQGDVEWLPAFSGQHPYLVWSLYRISGGRIEQLGQSPVKHAFFSVNSGCSCSGGNILWVGCGDTYGVGTNESRNWLGPRGELEAHTGLWEQCGSHFDGTPLDCVRDHGSSGHASNLDHRLTAEETDLGTAGARYLFDSWYIVKDDIDIFNTMGYREVDPSFNGSVWTFPFGTNLVHGSVLDEWVDPNVPAADARNATMTTRAGHLQLAVRTADLGGGVWRYEYALMNHDFDAGISELSIPLAPGVVVSAMGFRDLDDDPANDWTATVGASAVVWAAPAGGPGLDWGTLYNFTLEAAQAPLESSAGLVEAETGGTLRRPATLAPGQVGPIFADGFESGDTTRWSSATS